MSKAQVKHPDFHEEMQCFVRRCAYDFESRVGQVFLSDTSCTDMSGCINFFKRIDPAITTIRTFSGEKPDTIYFVRDGEWHAADGAAAG